MLVATVLPQTVLAEDDLCRRVLCYLLERGIDVDSIHVDADGDRILLSGRVPCQHARELACECCHRVAGVREVDCDLAVDRTECIPPDKPARAHAASHKPR